MNKNDEKNDARTTALKIGAVVLVVVFVFALVLLLLDIWEKNYGKYPESPDKLEDTLSYNGKDYVLKRDLETILLLGLDTFGNEDSGSYNNNKQADFLLLFVIDKASESCKAIHINRDTMTEMNILGVAGDKIGVITQQLALAHTYGNGKEVSCRNTANAVSKLLLGVEVDHYVSVSMDAVPVFNDLVGGVTLEVLDDLTIVDASMVKGETVTLMGDQALLYVRSRYGLEDPTNAGRMKRQKQYLEKLYTQSCQLSSEDSSFIPRVVLKLTDYIVSDCSGNKLESLLDRLSTYDLHTIYQLSGETVEGEMFMEFYPDEASVLEFVVECFYEIKE